MIPEQPGRDQEKKRRPLSPLFEVRKSKVSPESQRAEALLNDKRKTLDALTRRPIRDTRIQTVPEARVALEQVQGPMNELHEQIQRLEREISDPTENTSLAEAHKRAESAAKSLAAAVEDIENRYAAMDVPGGRDISVNDQIEWIVARGRADEGTRLSRRYDEARELLAIVQKPIAREEKPLRDKIQKLREMYEAYDAVARQRAEALQELLPE